MKGDKSETLNLYISDELSFTIYTPCFTFPLFKEVKCSLKSQIMDKDQMERSLQRMAHEIIEQNGLEKIRLVGIRSGVPLAKRLSSYLKHIQSGSSGCGGYNFIS